ncbi:MAG: hypothetical protein M3O30_17520 [Planctomycetota bacterium]|nr:hypothetical protein [Planctomycetota bacterium]
MTDHDFKAAIEQATLLRVSLELLRLSLKSIRGEFLAWADSYRQLPRLRELFEAEAAIYERRIEYLTQLIDARTKTPSQE